MTLGTRAVLHTARKWKKTLLLFCLLLFITTLVLSGLAIADAQEEQAEELRGTTGASFSVERDVSTGGWTTDSHGTYSTQDFITEDMIQEIASVEGITAYDASIISMPALYTESGMELPSKTWGYYIYGSINSEYNSLFLSGRFRLIDGSHITKDMENGIIISQEIAEQNGLEIGDSLTGIINPDIDDPAVDIEIVGIFDVVADKDLSANMYDDSSYWDYSNYAFCSIDAAKTMGAGYIDGAEITDAFFYVSDAAKLDNIIEEVQNISSIDWNNFKITANNEVYENISASLSDTGTLITTLIVVITVVSMVLITLILSMSIRSRKKETGILLAVGIAKPAVILQYALETMLIAIVAFPLAYLSSKQVAGALGALFGKTAANVIVTPQHFMIVAVVGAALLLASVMLSCIPAIRLKPKQILAQME